MRALFLFAVITTGALAAPGCGPSCDRSDRVVDKGILIESGPHREFQTSPPEGPYLPFEGGTTLKIRHGFGFRPSKPVVYLSFTERPLDSGKDGYSQAAGNQAITLRHDAEEIAIFNGSCANYYIRVVISGIAPPDDAGAVDATAADTAVSDAADGG